MQRRALGLSLGLHGVVLALMLMNFNFSKEYTKAPPAILMVDLTKVKIADTTNLPQKAVPKKTQPKPQLEKTEQKPTAKVEQLPPKQIKQPDPKPLPKEVPPPQNAVPVQTTKSKEENKKTKDKTQPKPTEKTPPKKADYNLKSLLASVEKVRQDAPAPSPKEDIPQPQEALDNGTEGNMDKILSISHRDYIATKLRDCWNIDGGAQNIEEITIEIRVLLNQDGSIREATIMNKMNLPAFQSLSESAKRAVFICAQKGEDSPFKILADNYADHYKDWKELHLNFNPMRDNVF